MFHVIAAIAIFTQLLLPAIYCPCIGRAAEGGGGGCCKIVKTVVPKVTPVEAAKRLGAPSTPKASCQKACAKRCSKHVSRQSAVERSRSVNEVRRSSVSACGSAAKSCACRCSKQLPTPKQPATPPETPAPVRVQEEKAETAALVAALVVSDDPRHARMLVRDFHDPPPDSSHNCRQAELEVWLY